MVSSTKTVYRRNNVTDHPKVSGHQILVMDHASTLLPWPLDKRLKQLLQITLPCGPSSNLSAISIDRFPVELTSASVNVNLVSPEPAGTLPGETDGPEEEDNGDGKALHEEILGSTNTATADGSSNGNIDLKDLQLASQHLGEASGGTTYLSAENNEAEEKAEV